MSNTNSPSARQIRAALDKISGGHFHAKGLNDRQKHLLALKLNKALYGAHQPGASDPHHQNLFSVLLRLASHEGIKWEARRPDAK